MHVNVLERRVLVELARLDLGRNPQQPVIDRRRVVRGNDALLGLSIAAWARLAAMSSRHNRLSTAIEAFISRITAAGPPAKRPPHI